MTRPRAELRRRRILSLRRQSCCRRSTERLRKFKSAHGTSLQLRIKPTPCMCVHLLFQLLLITKRRRAIVEVKNKYNIEPCAARSQTIEE
ncbi:hypothetical protein V3C99_015296 [Haemonchus contortus]